jgi:DNA-binding Lrp family transcriptional regulator
VIEYTSDGVGIYALRLRTRATRRGPELQMLQSALKCGLAISSREVLILREAFLPSGVPDLIAVETRHIRMPISRQRRKLRLCDLRILHFLNDSGPASEADIERLLNFSAREIAGAVENLLAAGLLTRKDALLSARAPSKVFVARRIVAVEAKMRAWRDALEQAAANLWFASHSYILVPALKCLRAIREEAKKLGIGVLVFDGRRTRTLVRPRKQIIPASYGSWLINEWAVQQMG